MDGTGTVSIPASLEKANRERLHSVNLAGKSLLFQKRAFTIRRVDEFRPMSQVCGNQSEWYAIAMKPPAGIMPDRIHTNIHQIAVG